MGDRDSGHRTGKPRQAGGKGVRIEEIVGRCSAGGRDPQRLMAGPRRPSDGTLGGGQDCRRHSTGAQYSLSRTGKSRRP